MNKLDISVNSKICRKVFTILAFLLCGGLVILTYIWFISTGLWIKWPATTNYYDRLAKSFTEGHLYLDAQPDPALLQLPDPYDPDARKTIQGLGIEDPNTIWDMSLYGGKIYLYWGPVPALILASIKLFYKKEIGDQQLTFIFISGLFFFQALILLKVWRRFLPGLPAGAVLSAILLVGFINPTLWILNIPRIYEAAIASDQFFFIGGLYFVFTGLDRLTYSTWRLALAGSFWLFAIGSRATMVIPISFLVLMVILKLIKRGKNNNSTALLRDQLAGFCIPLLGGSALLGWYNQARFGSIFEFGFRYVITMLNQNKFQGILFLPIYIIPNLYLYLFNPPVINSVFPFVRPVWNGDFITNFNNHFFTIYNAERIAGLIYVFPFSIFALITVINIIRHFLKQRGRGQAGQEKDLGGNNNDLFRWMLIGLTGSLFLEFMTILILFYGTMRYFMDVTPTLALLSILGFWQGYSTIIKTPVWSKVYPVIGTSLIYFSIILSILLSFSSDINRIRTNNPTLLAHLRLFFTQFMNNSGK
jgi:hypothetical protein